MGKCKICKEREAMTGCGTCCICGKKAVAGYDDKQYCLEHYIEYIKKTHNTTRGENRRKMKKFKTVIKRFINEGWWIYAVIGIIVVLIVVLLSGEMKV